MKQYGVDFVVIDGDPKETTLESLLEAKRMLRTWLDGKGYTKIVRARRRRVRHFNPLWQHKRFFCLDVWVDAP